MFLSLHPQMHPPMSCATSAKVLMNQICEDLVNIHVTEGQTLAEFLTARYPDDLVLNSCDATKVWI